MILCDRVLTWKYSEEENAKMKLIGITDNYTNEGTFGKVLYLQAMKNPDHQQ